MVDRELRIAIGLRLGLFLGSWDYGRVSSPGESHPEALAELYVSLSTHTAPIMEPRPAPICQWANNAGARREMRAFHDHMLPKLTGDRRAVAYSRREGSPILVCGCSKLSFTIPFFVQFKSKPRVGEKLQTTIKKAIGLGFCGGGFLA